MRKLSIPYTFDNMILDKIEAVDLLNIKEVYMPLPYDIMPSGRMIGQNESDYYKTIYRDKIKQAKELEIEVNLLATKPMFDMDTGITTILKTVNEITELKQLYDIDKITIGNLTFLNMYGSYFNEIGVRIELSVLADIDSIEKAKYLMTVYPYIDSICVKSNMLNNYDELVSIKKAFPKLKLKVLVNHLCLYNCPSHVQHHTVYSNIIPDNEDRNNIRQLHLASNYRQITQNCKFCDIYTRHSEVSVLKDTSFVRPEDLHIYDDVIDLFKLSGREHSSINIAKHIRAYGTRQHEGDIKSICDFPMYLPKDVINENFPDGYGEQKKNCNHKCSTCNYCDTVADKVYVESKMPTNPFL